MQAGRSKSLTTVLLIGLTTLGLFGTGAVSAQTGEICELNPQLELADGNGDGVVSIEEIDEIIELVGGNEDLESVRDQAVAAGITGIRYTDCDPSAGKATPVATPVGGTPVATPADGTPVTVSAPRNAVGDVDTDGAASVLETGSNLLAVGTGGFLVLAGAVIFRMGRKA